MKARKGERARGSGRADGLDGCFHGLAERGESAGAEPGVEGVAVGGVGAGEDEGGAVEGANGDVSGEGGGEERGEEPPHFCCGGGFLFETGGEVGDFGRDAEVGGLRGSPLAEVAELVGGASHGWIVR